MVLLASAPVCYLPADCSLPKPDFSGRCGGSLKIIDVFDSAKIYLLLFAVWNMYLAMKLFLRKDTREVTYSLPWINKSVWCIIFQIFYLLLTLPYLIWLWNGTRAAGYEKTPRS